MIMDESYRQDLLEHIAETPDLIFEAYDHTRESVMQHIEELWMVYQKDIEEYECNADWSYIDAMQEVLGILIPNTASPAAADASENVSGAEWVLTDNDNFQIQRKIEEDIFELYQIDAVAPSWEEGDPAFRVSHAVIYICDIDQDSMMDCYGYGSLEAFKEEYGDGWKGILAECDFEITAQNGECFISPDLSWKEAKNLICQLSGYQEEANPQDATVKYRVCGLQFPLEDGITADGILQLLKMVSGEAFDFLRVDAEASAAIFIINSDVYAQWESERILLAFKAFVREILDDKKKETEDGIYPFEDARILNEDGTVAAHTENIYLNYC